MSPRILILDSYYPDFVDTLPEPTGKYETELRRVLDFAFGTADFYSRHLKTQGWECADVIFNHHRLQRLWALENGWAAGSAGAIALGQIEAFRPDVLFFQDLNLFDYATLRMLEGKYVLAAQCSCPMPPERNAGLMSAIFTSFPHYVPRFKTMGVSSVEYLPLAFEASMLGPEVPRQYDISFVGGAGKKSHWKAGTDVLERVAEHFKERFIWFGYGVENLEKGSPLRSRYAGAAWGRDLYDVYARSKIVVNRHGEVAEGYANNLRMYEATGMGAVLCTEAAPNLEELFPYASGCAYQSADELIKNINLLLEHEYAKELLAERAKLFLLANHTYDKRMKVVSDVLLSCLEVAA